ncbi:hypothetical protein F4804DRAFT_323468 [Jackrogersella minutella]|nr:hypothetical protein F4804DRAFT_323468 [Jackrogersella minutella]
MSVFAKINTLHAEASQILRPVGRAPTRAEYATALELADAAMELALGADLAGPAIETCTAFQRFCYDPLLRCYSRTVDYERSVYERNASNSSRRIKRGGRLFNTDAGEHLLEAFEAVRIGRILETQERADALWENRKIRWIDEVENQPIRTFGLAAGY